MGFATGRFTSTPAAQTSALRAPLGAPARPRTGSASGFVRLTLNRLPAPAAPLLPTADLGGTGGRGHLSAAAARGASGRG